MKKKAVVHSAGRRATPQNQNRVSRALCFAFERRWPFFCHQQKKPVALNTPKALLVYNPGNRETPNKDAASGEALSCPKKQACSHLGDFEKKH